MKSVYFSLIMLCVVLISTQAQNSKNDSVLLNRELTLEKEYNPDIDNAIKVNQLPELREPQAPKSIVEFSNYTVPYSTQHGIYYLPIQSYASEIERLNKIGYLTAGLSSLLDIDGDLGVLILNNSQNHLSIQASHRSSNSNVSYLHYDEKQKMKINDNWGSVNFAHDFGKLRLNLGTKYTYSGFNYYGPNSIVDPIYYTHPGVVEPLFIDKKTNQINNLFEIEAGVTSSETEDYSYLLNFDYKRFAQKYGSFTDEDGRNENQFGIGAGAGYKFSDEMRLGVQGNFRNFSYSSIAAAYQDNTYGNQDYSLITLNPYLDFQGFDWKLRLGIREDFQIGGRKKANLAPDIHFNYVFNRRFQFDISATGGIKANSNYNLFYENRYVDPSLRITDSRTPLNADLRLNYLILDNLKIGAFGGYEFIKDEHFLATVPIYRTDDMDRRTILHGQSMQPFYEDVNLFKFGFSTDYSHQDIFEFKLKGIFNSWTRQESIDGLDFVPYGKPNFIGDLNIAYKFDAIPLRLDAYYRLETGRKFWQTEDKNNSINDLSLKGSYLFNSTLSFYLKANNLLFQDYEFWYGYPAQGFNIMGGLSVKF